MREIIHNGQFRHQTMDFGIIRGTRDKIREYSILVLLDSFVEKSIDL